MVQQFLNISDVFQESSISLSQIFDAGSTSLKLLLNDFEHENSFFWILHITNLEIPWISIGFLVFPKIDNIMIFSKLLS